MRLGTTTMVASGVAWIAVASLASLAVAQQSSRDGTVLHEYFDPGAVDPSTTSAESSVRDAPSETATESDEPPGLTLDPGGGDRILGANGPVESGARQPPYGPPSPRSGSSSLDANTDRVDDLEYNSSFDPSVFPYKRNVAQNRVYRADNGQYRFETEPGSRERVPVDAEPASSREDVFWGSFLVRAQSGASHAIPSVAPRQRILEVRSEPEADVDFVRDEAGNYYAEVDHDGLVRLNVKVAAPQFYFRGRFLGDVSWADFSAFRQPELEPEIRGAARRVADTVGVNREMDPASAVRRLVEYYRNFETKELPEQARGDDLYETISKRQVGVCRHRSMGFVVTARHLGIPARYVTNEAHAFIEVWWPNTGWRRVDLGGAAREISYSGERDDRLHDAAQRDPLPKPPRYREELRQAESGGSGGGTVEGDAAERTDRSDEGAPSGDAPADSERERSRPAASSDAGTEGVSRPGRADVGAVQRRRRSSGSETGQTEEPTSEGGPSGSGSPASEGGGDGERTATRLTLETESRTVFRGGDLTVRGRLESESGAALGGADVVLYFGRVGAPTSEMKQLGVATTDARGSYRVDVTVPETTGIGRWSLIAVFPGNDSFAESRAD